MGAAVGTDAADGAVEERTGSCAFETAEDSVLLGAADFDIEGVVAAGFATGADSARAFASRA